VSGRLRYVLLRHDLPQAKRRRLLGLVEIRAVHQLASGAVVVELEGDQVPELLAKCASVVMSPAEVAERGLLP